MKEEGVAIAVVSTGSPKVRWFSRGNFTVDPLNTPGGQGLHAGYTVSTHESMGFSQFLFPQAAFGISNHLGPK